MADRNFYRFRTEWPLSASTDVVFVALAELADYPVWWPEVRTAIRIDDQAYRLTCRSALPYDLDFVTRQSRMDGEAGILEANMTGDLEGFSRWTITPAGAAASAVFEEEVTANKALLRKLALVARPAFQVNHALMMKHGRRGLATYLAGMRLGRATAPDRRLN